MLARLRREWQEKKEGSRASHANATGVSDASADADDAAAANTAPDAEGRQRARQARLLASSSGVLGSASSLSSRLAPVAEDRAATPFGVPSPLLNGGRDADAADADSAAADADTDARLLALADEPRFAPFVRQDAYGQGGAGPWTWGERARLLCCCATLVPLRALAALLCVACYYATCRAASALPPPRTALGQAVRRTQLARAGRFWSRACLLALGFWRVRWLRVANDGTRRPAGPPWRRKRLAPAALSSSSAPRSNHHASSAPPSSAAPSSLLPPHAAAAAEDVPPPCVVANHLGWLDILVVMSRYFPSFVAREGTQDLPLVGLISRQMQCLYVDREKKGGVGSSGQKEAGRGEQHGQGQQQQHQQQAGDGGGGASGNKGSSVGAAVRARMRRAAARTGLLEAMVDAEGVDPASSGGGSTPGAAAAAAAMESGDDAGGDAGAERPMLLFPEGTTSNGRYLLPFRTGAFLAGVPVRPVVLSYSSCGGGLAGGRRPGGVRVGGGGRGGGRRSSGGGGGSGGGGSGGVVGPKLERYCDRGGGSGGGRLSLAWESITALTHVLLVLASPWQSATCLELPLCVPTREERADPHRFAVRVRGELLRATALLPSDSGLEEKREYQQRLREVLAARDNAAAGKRRRHDGGGGGAS